MVLVHDDDLGTIGGLGHDGVSGLLNTSNHIVPSCWQSIETLDSDVMTDLLQRSNIKINTVRYGELSIFDIVTTLILTRAFTPKDLSLPVTDDSEVPNTDTAVNVIKVAMLPMTSQNWSK
jgi:hypothetical protein